MCKTKLIHKEVNMLRYNMDIGLHKNIKNIFKNKGKVIILHEEARHRISTDSNYIF